MRCFILVALKMIEIFNITVCDLELRNLKTSVFAVRNVHDQSCSATMS